ncbi:hypothetical protein [Nocardioides litoris]|uniref:hypothetical protein n=1 Tax=Nocardioides litoris TaxID=1926648 RepID=UPI001120AECF|nr:hypothetical protein [Nocardioides litoris]
MTNPNGHPPDLPADVRLWMDRAAADEPTPWDEMGVEWTEDGAPGATFDHAYLSEDELAANADLAANVRAINETAALVHWVLGTDEDQVVGYWRGPEATPLAEAPLVLYGSEGQFELVGARSVTEWLALESTEHGDDDWDDVVAACREAGVTGELRGIEEWQVPEVAVGPADLHQQRYRAHLGQAG